MTDIALAHQELAAFCSNSGGKASNPGIALGVELFQYLVQKAITDAGDVGNVKFPTNSSFANLAVSFSGTADGTALQTRLEAGAAAPPNYPPPKITFQDLRIEVSIFLAGERMSVNALAYSDIVCGVALINGDIRLHGGRAQGEWTAVTEDWQAMTHLPDGAEFTDELKDEWRVQEAAFKIIAKDTLFATILESVDIPNILDMFTSVEFIGPVSVGGSTDLIMFSGPADWVIDCPRQPVPAGGGYDRKPDGVTVPAENHPWNAWDDDPPIEPTASGDLFVHLPKPFIEKRFDGVVKPAATAADSGHFGPISWDWVATISVETFTATMVQPWPPLMLISAPSIASGVAGAGVKIGCIYVNVAGVAFKGKINPLEIYFQLGVDPINAEIYFKSRLGRVQGHDFEFIHSPALGFPIDQIADKLLAEATKELMRSQAGKILKVSRFSLVNFHQVRGFGAMRPLLAAHQGAGGNSLTLGAVFVK